MSVAGAVRPLPPAVRVRGLIFFPIGIILFVAAQGYLLIQRAGAGEVPVGLIVVAAVTPVLVIAGIVVVKVGQVRARRRLRALQDRSWTIVAPSTLRSRLSGHPRYRSAMYPIIVFDEDAIRFPSLMALLSRRFPGRRCARSRS